MDWLAGYDHRQQVSIKRVSGAVSDYQMKLTVHKTTGDSSGAVVYLKNHALSWTGTVPNDIRFTKADGTTELDYWIENSDANTATVWIEFDPIETTDTDFYIYYGKATDTTTSNGAETFLFFDHYPGVEIDAEKWTVSGEGESVADSILTVPASCWVGGIPTFAKPCAFGALINQGKTATVNWTGTGFNENSSEDQNQEQIRFTTEAGSTKATTRVPPDQTDTVLDDFTGAYKVFEILWSTDNAIFIIDDSTVATHTEDVPTHNQRATFLNLDSGVSILVDWVFIRNYELAEPTW